MTTPIASVTRATIRQRIGDNLGAIIISTASTSGTGSTLIDTLGLQRGGDDEYNGGQIQITAVAATASSANTGIRRWVSDFTGSTKTAIITPAYAASILIDDSYELWKAKPGITIEQVNRLITEAESLAIPFVYSEKNDVTTYTESHRYTYAIPSGFVALSKIEYVEATKEDLIIHDCDRVWNESVDSDVTASIDSTLERGSKPSLKLVVAAAAASADILATEDISALDLRACTDVEMSVYSSVALAASTLQLLLSGTASCVTPVESLNLPSITAKTWTRMALSLTAQQSDTAIISVGIKMPIDPGAFTLYARKIHGVDANSRVYEHLRPEYWKIIRGSTNYLKLEYDGMDVVGEDTLLRLNGYQNITAMTADADTCQIDPTYIENYVTGRLLSAFPTDENKARLQQRNYVLIAEEQRKAIATSLSPGTRYI